MKFQGVVLALASAALLAPFSSANAQNPPSLDQQKVWTDADKKEFLRYLNSNQPMPSGQVKTVAAPAGESFSEHAAWVLEAGPASTTLFPFAASGHGAAASGQIGARALYERHFLPWLRVYAGLEAEPMRQKEIGGGTANLTRWAVPAGVEFALVPLSTPQTRYVLLRLGVQAADVDSSAHGSDFSQSVLGTSAAWDLGLGYEWQIPDSNWRLNAAVDGLRSIGNPNGLSYYGLGLSGAVAYTF